MKLDPLELLLNENFEFNKKFLLISGNETTLIEKIQSEITRKFKRSGGTIENIESIDGFIGELGLFENKKLFLGRNCKGLEKENLERIRGFEGSFIFIQENSKKIKSVKKFFLEDRESYSVDCYELDRGSKIKILNTFLNRNKIKMDEELYWIVLERLDSKYIFLESSLNKILELGSKSVNAENIKKILTIDNSGKEKVFFQLLKKNKDIVEFYREKIITTSDVNEFYYYCKFFCQLIIESKNRDDYGKKIPAYLFREKNYLFDIYKRYNLKKKKMLLRLLSSTEKALRNHSGLSLVYGLRFLLNIKKITIS